MAAMRFNKQSSIAILLAAAVILASFHFEGAKGDVTCIADCSDFTVCSPAACDAECSNRGFKNGGSWVFYRYKLHCCCNLASGA